MIQLGDGIALSERELKFQFVRATGPGGQNVNKVATAVVLRFDAAHSPSLPAAARTRLVTLAGRRATADGVIAIRAERFRTQGQNREDAVRRLVALIRQALVRPRFRIATRPSRAAGERRLDAKRRRSHAKRARGRIRNGGE